MMTPVNMHMARSAMNRDPQVREWVEQFLKEKERSALTSPMTEEEFEKHWRYVRPERMHEGAIEGVTAFVAQQVQQ